MKPRGGLRSPKGGPPPYTWKKLQCLKMIFRPFGEKKIKKNWIWKMTLADPLVMEFSINIFFFLNPSLIRIFILTQDSCLGLPKVLSAIIYNYLVLSQFHDFRCIWEHYHRNVSVNFQLTLMSYRYGETWPTRIGTFSCIMRPTGGLTQDSVATKILRRFLGKVL